MAALPVRNALASLTEILGDPRKVLYSAGSILAAFACSPSNLDAALESAAAQVRHAVDVPGQGHPSLIRVGVMDAVHFYAEVKPGEQVVSIRLYSPASEHADPHDLQVALDLADAAFRGSGDAHQALLSYLSSKLLEDDAGHAERLASDLARLVSDYLRMKLVAQGDTTGGSRA